MNTANKELPYTTLVINKIIEEIEKEVIIPANSSLNGEFTAGCDHTKKMIIKKIKTLKF